MTSSDSSPFFLKGVRKLRNLNTNIQLSRHNSATQLPVLVFTQIQQGALLKTIHVSVTA